MKRALGFLRTLLRQRAGSSILEFAIGSGLLVAAGTATFQYGYIFYQYNALKNAVSTGARWAAMAGYDSATTTPSTAFTNRVKNMVVYGDPAGGTTPVVPNLTTANVQLEVQFANSVPVAMTVAISNYSINGIFGSMNCDDKPVVRYAYQGIWAPVP